MPLFDVIAAPDAGRVVSPRYGLCRLTATQEWFLVEDGTWASAEHFDRYVFFEGCMVAAVRVSRRYPGSFVVRCE
jgi:hypothetical protein